jgi:hypothetical protein
MEHPAVRSVGQAGGFLGIARLAIGGSAELGFASSVGAQIDAMGMSAPVRGDRLEHRAGIMPDEVGLATLLGWRVVITEGGDSDHLG